MTLQEYLAALAKLIVVPVETLRVSQMKAPAYREVFITDLDGYAKSSDDTSPMRIFYYLPVPTAYTIRKLVTQFSVVHFPGCCAFAISTGAYVEAEYRRKGVNRLSNQFRQSIARQAGYTALICTDKLDNTPERKTLEAEGWKDIYSVTNSRTNNLVAISIKEL